MPSIISLKAKWYSSNRSKHTECPP